MRLANREAGFSLIEVLVASTILGVGIVALLSALSHASSSLARCKEVTVAAALARSKIEEVLSEEELETGSDSGDFDPPYTAYAWETETFEVPVVSEEGLETTSEDLLGVRVRVSWKRQDKVSDFRLETLRLKEMPSLPFSLLPFASSSTRTDQAEEISSEQGGLGEQGSKLEDRTGSLTKDRSNTLGEQEGSGPESFFGSGGRGR